MTDSAQDVAVHAYLRLAVDKARRDRFDCGGRPAGLMGRTGARLLANPRRLRISAPVYRRGRSRNGASGQKAHPGGRYLDLLGAGFSRLVRMVRICPIRSDALMACGFGGCVIRFWVSSSAGPPVSLPQAPYQCCCLYRCRVCVEAVGRRVDSLMRLACWCVGCDATLAGESLKPNGFGWLVGLRLPRRMGWVKVLWFRCCGSFGLFSHRHEKVETLSSTPDAWHDVRFFRINSQIVVILGKGVCFGICFVSRRTAKSERRRTSAVAPR